MNISSTKLWAVGPCGAEVGGIGAALRQAMTVGRGGLPPEFVRLLQRLGATSLR